MQRELRANPSVMRARLLFLACWIWVGCQYDPHAHLLTTREPKPEDLIGTYVLDAIHPPDRVGGILPHIGVELRADGTFSATNVPPWTSRGLDKSFVASLLSGEGRWEKGTVGILDGRQTLWGVYLRTPDNRFHPAGLTGDAPPHGLVFTLGDPDTGEAVLLKRRP